MAAISSVVLEYPASSRTPSISPSWRRSTWHSLLLLLTAAMFLIHGYHPFAEDGGIYVAGTEYLLDATLFPHNTAFVTAHLHYSVFAYSLAALVRITHLRLEWVLLGAYTLSLWLMLYASLQVLQRCRFQPRAQLAGASLLAVWATLPVAGTSLLLLDPYLTARSLSTPLSLLAIAFALDDWSSGRDGNRSLLTCMACLALAALFHPLMAAYAVAMVISLRIVRLRSWPRAALILAGVALIAATAAYLLAPPESPTVVAASVSRYYWFLSQWHWYELCGLIGPVVILTLLLVSHRDGRSPIVTLCRASLIVGIIATLTDLLYAHRDAPTHLVARLQPLRVFLLLYAIMTLLLAASLTQRLLASRLSTQTRWLILSTVFLLNACTLFYVQRMTFPASRHLELPWLTSANPWSQAFLWARNNTPTTALFALDADYITTSGEDAQTFRATARRSALPDFSKDGGEASITPSLAQLWQQGVTAQQDLSAQPDALRAARLRPLGVTWMVLHASAITRFPCPFDNGVVKVCRLEP
jgi:hypothetical protein